MAKHLLNAKISVIVAVIIALLVVFPVYAASIWISVNPGSQTVSTTASWEVYEGKEPGCPEHNLKWKVTFGDGFYYTLSNVWACYPYYTLHGFTNSGNYTQKWYVGQGSGSFTYKLSTSVHRN
jgi:hypothetical protein